VDTTVVEADIDYPTDADLLEHAVRKLGGLVRRIKARGAARRTRFRDRGRAAGRRMKQLARTLRRRTGVAMGEVDRLTGEVAGIARQSLEEVQAVLHNARRAGARRSGDGGWVGWSASWRRRSRRPSGCWPRPTSAWPATG
jgi:IS5 family transposase